MTEDEVYSCITQAVCSYYRRVVRMEDGASMTPALLAAPYRSTYVNEARSMCMLLLLDAGLSQESVARRLGRTQPTVASITARLKGELDYDYESQRIYRALTRKVDNGRIRGSTPAAPLDEGRHYGS